MQRERGGGSQEAAVGSGAERWGVQSAPCCPHAPGMGTATRGSWRALVRGSACSMWAASAANPASHTLAPAAHPTSWQGFASLICQHTAASSAASHAQAGSPSGWTGKPAGLMAGRHVVAALAGARQNMSGRSPATCCVQVHLRSGPASRGMRLRRAAQAAAHHDAAWSRCQCGRCRFEGRGDAAPPTSMSPMASGAGGPAIRDGAQPIPALALTPLAGN